MIKHATEFGQNVSAPQFERNKSTTGLTTTEDICKLIFPTVLNLL